MTNFKPGNVYQLTTHHIGDVLVTFVTFTTNYKGCQLARVFCHSQNIFYPVDVSHLRPVR